jgi:hypothetical protein
MHLQPATHVSCRVGLFWSQAATQLAISVERVCSDHWAQAGVESNTVISTQARNFIGSSSHAVR